MKRKLLVLVVLAAVATPVAAADEDSLFNSLSYRLVGPYRGGRVTAVAGVPGDPMTYYMGSTGGGVWKTTDAGKTWRNVSDAMRELEPSSDPEIMGEVDPALAEVGLLREPIGGLPTTGTANRKRAPWNPSFSPGPPHFPTSAGRLSCSKPASFRHPWKSG